MKLDNLFNILKKIGALFSIQDALVSGVTSKEEAIGFLLLNMHWLVAADERPCICLRYLHLLPADVADVGLPFFRYVETSFYLEFERAFPQAM